MTRIRILILSAIALCALLPTAASGGSGGHPEVVLCAQHAQHIAALKAQGRTHAQVHADFQAWLDAQGEQRPSLAQQAWYAPTVRAMIDLAYADAQPEPAQPEPGRSWREAALRHCIAAARGAYQDI